MGSSATTSTPLPPAGNVIMWSAFFGSPEYNGRNPAETKSNFVIMRETLAHKNFYDNLTRMATVDDIINANASKALLEATN